MHQGSWGVFYIIRNTFLVLRNTYYVKRNLFYGLRNMYYGSSPFIHLEIFDDMSRDNIQRGDKLNER